MRLFYLKLDFLRTAVDFHDNIFFALPCTAPRAVADVRAFLVESGCITGDNELVMSRLLFQTNVSIFAVSNACIYFA